MSNERLLLEEHERRRRLKASQEKVIAALVAELFDRQRDFFLDPSKKKSVLGSRRAGKTEMWVRIAVIYALRNPRQLIRIWSASRLRNKELLWNNFKYLLARNGIKATPNDTELSITFENGAIVRLVGADKDKEAQKKRGDKTVLEVVLETQSFGPYIRSLIDDVIEPSTIDLRGTICLEGTPGPLCVGYWYEITGGNDHDTVWRNSQGWSIHRWTLVDNPYIPHAALEVEALRVRRGWGLANPTYLREYCGRWVNDLSALYYKYDGGRNLYNPSVVQPYGPGWTHALGWDLGSRDDMALVIWGWHPSHEALYEVFSWKKPGALGDEVMGVISQVERDKGLSLIESVADTQGGGKMFVEEVMSRHTRRFTAAKKSEKYQHVMLFNDDLLTGRIKLLPGSPLQVEMAELMRDPDWPDPDKPDAPPTEHPRYPNHCCDAGLYSFRAAQHYFRPGVEAPPPKVGEPAWLTGLAARFKQQEEMRHDQVVYGFGAE